MKIRHLPSAVLSIVLLNSCISAPPPAGPLGAIDTIVVIYAENHSFDNMYGLFPKANGIAAAFPYTTRQLDHDGTVLPHLPPVYTHGKPDPDYPQQLPNGPFRIDAPPVNRRFDERVPSPVHTYWRNIEQINNGNNNKFVAMSDTGAWTMGYYDGSSLRMWKWAQRYTLADTFFMGAFGSSFLNHHWLICACTPEYKGPPSSSIFDSSSICEMRSICPEIWFTNPCAAWSNWSMPAIVFVGWPITWKYWLPPICTASSGFLASAA